MVSIAKTPAIGRDRSIASSAHQRLIAPVIFDVRKRVKISAVIDCYIHTTPNPLPKELQCEIEEAGYSEVVGVFTAQMRSGNMRKQCTKA